MTFNQSQQSQPHNHFRRWRRYHFGIRPSFTSLLLLGGVIELNPGPARKNRKHLMSVAHLNVRSVASRENFYLLKRTVTTNNFDIFTVSESWLDRTVCDADILIPGYTTFRQHRAPHKETVEFKRHLQGLRH